MKKLVTLLAAAGMVVAASAPANAVDIKADASWRASMSTGSLGFEGTNTSWARQRLRLGLTATASENLSGYFQFQIGKDRWGTTTNTHGAHDGDDGNNITLRQSYIDWTVPATAVKVRMGRFAMGLPGDAFGSNAVYSGDWGNKEGVAISAPVTDWLGLSAMWTRAGSDGKKLDQSNYDDIFALAANLKFNGVSGTVYAAYAAIDGSGKYGVGYHTYDDGKNTTDYSGLGANYDFTEGDIYWVGFTSTLSAFDPFTLKLSAAYGSFEAKDDLADETAGWNVQAKASYKLGFGTPVLGAWYFSGMDDERDGVMPSLGGYFTPTRAYHDAGKGLCGGHQFGLPTGSWGVQAGIEGMSFISGLSHDFLVTYMEGTNDEDAVDGSFFELSDKDSLVEFDLVNSYKIYKNLTAHLELSYIISDFGGKQIEDKYTEDDWKAELTFQYKF